MCSVVNGGYYYQPHLVTRIKDSNGSVIKTVNPVLMKQTISSNISTDIRSYMHQSVLRGTSQTSRVQGYSSGGKTGTAEKLPRGGKERLVSFIGAAPIDDPQLVVYVVVDEANAEDQGQSSFASTIASNIFSEALPYLQIFPTEEVTETTNENTSDGSYDDQFDEGADNSDNGTSDDDE